MPPVVPPSPPRRDRDTVLSVGDTESLIDLYVHSAPARVIDSSERMAQENIGAGGGDPSASAGMHHHYPGRPLPHPPGASQSGPVRPVLLDAFLGSGGGGGGGNIPGGLPPYEEIELERQGGQAGLWHFLPSFSQTKAAASPPQPPQPQEELFTVFDEDAQEQETEPSSPGSTYEMPPSTPPSSSPRECEFADMPDEEEDEELSTVTSNSTARNIAAALPTYCNCGSPERARAVREWATGEALWVGES